MELTDEYKTCRLCLKDCKSTFEFVDEIIQSNLNSLLLYLDFEITNEPAICESCSDNIKLCLSFKSKCVLNEEHINSLMGSENNLKKDLRELYKNVIENGNLDDSSDSNVCRLCLELVKCGAFVALENDHADGLQKYFPELDLDAIYLPVTCVPCHESLRHHLDFITSCLQTEERIIEYYNVEGTDSKRHIDLNDAVKFTPKNMLKYKNEPCQVTTKEMYTDSEENPDDGYEIKTENVDIKSELDSKVEDEVDFQMEPLEDDSSQKPICVSKHLYKCTKCPYNAKVKYNVQRHMLRHKNLSEVITYNCTTCTFQTKYKSHLPRHMLVHKSKDEATMAKCHICGFQTKQIYYMTQHVRSHNKSVEDSTYRCGECNFETKHKKYLHGHMLVHKTSAEVRMYNCMDCGFGTKYRRCLQRHMLSHKTSSEVQMYKCVKCTYESKHQNNLNRHMIIHKGSEVPLRSSPVTPQITCTLCNYKTKRKSNLRRHMQIHKNTEISTYKCGICGLKVEHKSSFDEHLSRHARKETDNQKGVPDDVQECYFVDVANLEAFSEEEKPFVKACPDSD